MEAKEEREVISYQHGYQDGKKAGEKYALSKEGHEAISYLEGHQDGEKKGIDKGRKEVVEWIENRGGSLDGFREEWQAIRNGDYETD